jgi:hypothetical protein
MQRGSPSRRSFFLDSSLGGCLIGTLRFVHKGALNARR